MTRKVMTALFVLSLAVMGCGEDDSDSSDSEDDGSGTVSGSGGGDGGDDTADAADAVELGNDTLTFALNALQSSTVGGDAAALRLVQTEQDPDMPECSVNGEPFDTDTSDRMQPMNAEFARRTFHCQLAYNRSTDTVLGSFHQNNSILCDVERVIGTIEYTAEGNTYETNIEPTAGCGWPESVLSDIPSGGFPGTVVATSFETGDWDASISIEAAGPGIAFTLFMRASEGVVGFKRVNSWDHAQRVSDGEDSNGSVEDAAATGTSGGVIAIDVVNGILRAETIDTYWSRRARLYAVGTLDSATGAFSEITSAQGLQGNFDISVDPENDYTGLYGEVASVSGNSTDGFRFNSAQWSCRGDEDCDVRGGDLASVATYADGSPTTECYPATAACTGNDGLVLDTTTFSFFMSGAGWGDQSTTRSSVEAWLPNAGIPTFTTVDSSAVLQ